MKQKMYFLYQLTKSSLKLQNESSYLGIIWYLLGPLLLFCVLLFVFVHRLGSEIDQYPLYLLLGIIIWNFFSAATGRSMTTLVGHASIIKSHPVSFVILILSSVLHSIVAHLFELAVFFGVLMFFGITFSLPHIALFALSTLLFFLLTFGIACALASLYPFFRDLNQIWSVLLRVWWFATPIFYAPTPEGPGSRISLLNPMYYSIHIPRELIIYGRMPQINMFVGLGLFAATSCIVGYVCIRLMRNRCIELL